VLILHGAYGSSWAVDLLVKGPKAVRVWRSLEEMGNASNKAGDRSQTEKTMRNLMFVNKPKRKLWFAFLIAAAMGSFASCSQAQSKARKHAQWNWQRHQSEAIDYAKKYLVSKLEDGLPESSFADWFQDAIGSESQVDWEVNDCGEQTGTPDDRGRDFPLCISAASQPVWNLYITVNIQFGSFGRGPTEMQPVVRSINFGELFDSEWLKTLNELPQKVNAIKRTFEILDPNGGKFDISGTAPAAFDGFSMWIKTMDYNSGHKYVLVPRSGGVWFKDHQFAMRDVGAGGNDLSFETVRYRGVSFKFEGRSAIPQVKTEDYFDGQGVLKGHLIKLVHGRKTAEADLTFDHTYLYDCR
jgi:hypothetical protein